MGQNQGRPEDVTEGTAVVERVLPDDHRNINDYYEITNDKLGKGHYGLVKLAYDISTREPVAVKIVTKSKVRRLQMLRSEIKIMQSVKHSSIIELYDAFEDDENVYLVMERCTGGELFDRIVRKQYFDERSAAMVMKTILVAVKHLHDRHIVHRDLKPENFLFATPDENAELKMVDFGLSTVNPPDQLMHSRVGTPYYIAPEVLQKSYGNECDMWSVGVMMYILLCGYPPFWGDRDHEIFRKIRKGQYSFEGPEWETVSDQAKDLIRKLLTLFPQQRLTADQALAHPWIVSEGGRHARAITPRLLASLRRFTTYRKLKQIVLGVIAGRVDEVEVRDVKDAYDRMDPDGKGGITYQKLYEELKLAGHLTSQEEAFRLAETINTSGTGEITYEEFLAAGIGMATFLVEQRLYDAFETLDGDTSGHLRIEDIRRVLGPRNADKAELVMLESDLDGNNLIDYDEYLRAMCGNETGTRGRLE